ncbi:uncharacterized protein BDZ83DRAFT_127235 [Colletotrichum acutatum]|uniref:Uncharacterized protein n=1 Tax=Glomerella acutata TaxID=27357 RepID=A0AAD8UWM2_GLOAC|nr:uncharacterized protein BDZ83DRAFT_127235 [Colletotrichum acutatum]KAK1728424.1 hypothetical protein BDZ83DRAFT_127235 [Colletotrichum acutatum]
MHDTPTPSMQTIQRVHMLCAHSNRYVYVPEDHCALKPKRRKKNGETSEEDLRNTHLYLDVRTRSTGLVSELILSYGVAKLESDQKVHVTARQKTILKNEGFSARLLTDLTCSTLICVAPRSNEGADLKVNDAFPARPRCKYLFSVVFRPQTQPRRKYYVPRPPPSSPSNPSCASLSVSSHKGILQPPLTSTGRRGGRKTLRRTVLPTVQR